MFERLGNKGSFAKLGLLPQVCFVAKADEIVFGCEGLEPHQAETEFIDKGPPLPFGRQASANAMMRVISQSHSLDGWKAEP
jgi:hypothetical protein